MDTTRHWVGTWATAPAPSEAGVSLNNHTVRIYLLSAPLTIPLICCQINSFRRAPSCGEAMARRRKEERRAGTASRENLKRLGRFSSRVGPPGCPCLRCGA